jgi:hypothetical protein
LSVTVPVVTVTPPVVALASSSTSAIGWLIVTEPLAHTVP